MKKYGLLLFAAAVSVLAIGLDCALGLHQPNGGILPAPVLSTQSQVFVQADAENEMVYIWVAQSPEARPMIEQTMTTGEFFKRAYISPEVCRGVYDCETLCPD